MFPSMKDDAAHRMQHGKIYFNFNGEIYIPKDFTFADEQTA